MKHLTTLAALLSGVAFAGAALPIETMVQVDERYVTSDKLKDRVVRIQATAVARMGLLISGAGVIILTAFIFAQMFWRHALNSSLPWTEPAAGMIMGWVIFLGAAMGKAINVTAIAPGHIETANTGALRAGPLVDRIPAGRWGTPQDIDDTAVLPCSPAARNSHGAVLNVDGGWLAR